MRPLGENVGDLLTWTRYDNLVISNQNIALLQTQIVKNLIAPFFLNLYIWVPLTNHIIV